MQLLSCFVYVTRWMVPLLLLQIKELTSKLEDVTADRDSLMSKCKELQTDYDSLSRERSMLEGALSSATTSSAEMSALQVRGYRY